MLEVTSFRFLELRQLQLAMNFTTISYTLLIEVGGPGGRTLELEVRLLAEGKRGGALVEITSVISYS